MNFAVQQGTAKHRVNDPILLHISSKYSPHKIFSIKLAKYFIIKVPLCYAHTNQFCVVQENIKPEALKVQTELARSVQ